MMMMVNFNMTLSAQMQFRANGAETQIKYLERPHGSPTRDKSSVRC